MPGTKIYEITGVPGVGKSTVHAHLKDQASNGMIFFDEELVCVRCGLQIRNRLVAKLTAEAILVAWYFKKRSRYRKFLLLADQKILGGRESILNKLNLLRNVRLKIARFELARNWALSEKVIFDEGLSHVFFNLLDYRLDNLETLEKLFPALAEAFAEIHLVCLSHENIDMEARLRNRGHRRLPAGEDGLSCFVRTNEKVARMIMSRQGQFAEFLLIDPVNYSGLEILLNQGVDP